MPRRADPTRKPELLGQILDHLTGRTLATVSFRTLAEALGVSTYVFVYHFGNRAQLVEEIVRAIVSRHDGLLAIDAGSLDEEAWREFMASSWEVVTSPRELQLHRLELEAAMLEMAQGQPSGVGRAAVARWHAFTTAWCVGRGAQPERADVEARLFTDAIYGLLYDALATGDLARVTAGYRLHVDAFAARVRDLAGIAAA
jgi:AcrR family transcriptional regulator